MSTSPEGAAARSDDLIVSHLSEWLAFHVTNEELRLRLTEIGTTTLRGGQVEAVEELLEELAEAGAVRKGDLEMLVRETLEAVALG